MKEGTVFLYHAGDAARYWERALGKVIGFFTDSDYGHVSVYLNGKIWESVFGGPRCRTEPTEQPRMLRLEPRWELSEEERRRMEAYLSGKLGPGTLYNLFKLLALLIVYPTRRLWQKLGWVPFENDFFGVICSVYVDEAYKAAGIDLLPGRSSEYTVPGDFLRSDLLQPV